MFFLVPLNSQFFLFILNFLGKKSFYVLDQGWFEILGPKVLFYKGFFLNRFFRLIQGNNILVLIRVGLFFYLILTFLI